MSTASITALCIASHTMEFSSSIPCSSSRSKYIRALLRKSYIFLGVMPRMVPSVLRMSLLFTSPRISISAAALRSGSIIRGEIDPSDFLLPAFTFTVLLAKAVMRFSKYLPLALVRLSLVKPSFFATALQTAFFNSSVSVSPRFMADIKASHSPFSHASITNGTPCPAVFKVPFPPRAFPSMSLSRASASCLAFRSSSFFWAASFLASWAGFSTG